MHAHPAPPPKHFLRPLSLPFFLPSSLLPSFLSPPPPVLEFVASIPLSTTRPNPGPTNVTNVEFPLAVSHFRAEIVGGVPHVVSSP